MLIKSLTIVTSIGISQIEFGVDGVAEIIDCSTYSERHYCVKDRSGSVIRRVINCPVDIKYYPEPTHK